MNRANRYDLSLLVDSGGRETRNFQADSDTEAVSMAAGMVEGQLQLGLYESDFIELERTRDSRDGYKRLFSGTVSRFLEYSNKTFEAKKL